MSEKKRNLFRLEYVTLFVYISQSLPEASPKYSYCGMNAIHNRFSCISARTIVNEDDRIHDASVDACFRMNGENYRRGDCIEHITDVLHIFRGDPEPV